MRKAEIEALAGDLVRVAQVELDAWQQDADGMDEVLGAGGACGLIAEAMAGVLAENGVTFARVDTEFDGGHEFLVALVDEGVVMVDIPARVYETGGGYVWTKREGVILTAEDVCVDVVREPMSEKEFEREYCDGEISADISI